MRNVRSERFPRREGRPRRWHEPLKDRLVRAAEESGDYSLAAMLDSGPTSDVRTHLLDKVYPVPNQDTAYDWSGPEWRQDKRPTWTGQGGG